MIVQIDFKARSDSGNLQGRFKLTCDSVGEAEKWLDRQMENYNMSLLAGSIDISIVPDEYLEDRDLEDVIKIED